MQEEPTGEVANPSKLLWGIFFDFIPSSRLKTSAAAVAACDGGVWGRDDASFTFFGGGKNGVREEVGG